MLDKEKKDILAEALLFLVLVFVMASIYAVNHEEKCYNSKTKVKEQRCQRTQ